MLGNNVALYGVCQVCYYVGGKKLPVNDLKQADCLIKTFLRLTPLNL